MSLSPLKVVAITFGDHNTASTYFRLAQYHDLLASQGIELTYIPKQTLRLKHLKTIAQADLVINQKSLLNTFWRNAIRRAAKKLIFDWDDAFWTEPKKKHKPFTRWKVCRRLQDTLRKADLVVSANSYLDDYAKRYTCARRIIPMGVSTQYLPSKPRSLNSKAPTIIWLGAPSNLPFLEAIDEQLCDFLEQNPKAKLAILCGDRPNLSCEFKHILWTGNGCERAFIAQADIGIMPLPLNNEFSLGKSPIKSLSYMAAGLPVIGNFGAGGANDIAKGGGCINIEDYQSYAYALQQLLDPSVYTAASADAIENISKNYDIHKLAKNIANIWKEIAQDT